MIQKIDISELRREFPVTQRLLYLDSAHQSPLAASIKAAIAVYYDEAHYTAGPKPRWIQRAEETREKLAEFIGAEPGEIAYTRNTSEGLNTAINALPLKAGDNVLMIRGDHPNNTYAWLNLERKGVEVRFVELGSDREVACAGTFQPYIDRRTRAISLSHVTFHAGQRHDVASIGALCREAGIYLILDAMQSMGVLPVHVKELGVSMLAAGCHKGLLVSQGLGFLYVDKTLQDLRPAYLSMAGMAHPPADYIAVPEDMELRSGAGRFEMGNHNLPALHGLDASLDLINRAGVATIEEHVLSLGDRLIPQLDELGIRLVGPRDRAGRAHIYVLDLPTSEWMAYFDSHGVRVSPERGGIRVSFALFNQAEDVDRLIEVIRRR